MQALKTPNYFLFNDPPTSEIYTLSLHDALPISAGKLRTAGQLAEAGTAAEKLLAIQREVFGNVHEQVAGALQYVAELHEAREEFGAARKARQEVLAIKTKLHGTDHWQTTDARRA